MFAAMLREGGQISELEQRWYEDQYENWQILVPEAVPTHIIYLRVSPETCHKRVNTRGRASEKDLPLAYLQALHSKFEAYADNVKSREGGPKLIVVDAEQTDDKVYAEVVQHLYDIVATAAERQ